VWLLLLGTIQRLTGRDSKNIMYQQHEAIFMSANSASVKPPNREATASNEPVLITGADLERRLHISSHHRRELERYGLPVYRLSPQVRRYDLRAVEAWLAARLKEGEPT
jgi:hypothetical protein